MQANLQLRAKGRFKLRIPLLRPTLLLVLMWGLAQAPAPAQEASPTVPADAAPKPKPAPPREKSGSESPATGAKEKPKSQPSLAPDAAVRGLGPIRAVEPNTYFLPDKDGNLQQVLQYSYEDFVESLRIKSGLAALAKQPRFSLQQLDIRGRALGNHAALTVDVEILLRTDQWVPVPLGLTRAVLRKPAVHTGEGEHFLQFSERGGGYICWLQGKAGETHTFKLEVLVPLVKVGNETVLRLSMPRAATEQFSIEVDSPGAVGRVVEPAALLKTEKAKERRTLFTGVGVGGEFELAWRGADRPAVDVPSALEVSGAIRTQLDARSLRSDARLTVRSITGAPVEKFGIRLPRGARLIGGAQPGYTLGVVEEPENAKLGQLVEVRLDQSTAEPIEVRLATEQPHELTGDAGSVEFSGFEVLGAVQQWGHLAVEVAGEWQALWGEAVNLRQVDDLPETLRRPELTAGFEYFGQPFSLQAKVLRRSTRIQVEPELIFMVGARQTMLDARLKYTIRGAKAFELGLSMPGWKVESIGPANVVDVNGVIIDEDGLLTVPLLQPSTGQIELQLKARRDHDGDTISLPLPETQAGSFAPATVVVLPDDNVSLTPIPKLTTGLILQQIAPGVQLPARQQEPIYYRCEEKWAEFVAKIQVLPRAIAAEVNSQIMIEPTGGRVDQKIQYRIDYEPVDKLTLEVPRNVPLNKLEISLDGQKLTPVPLAEQPLVQRRHGVHVRVALPNAQIGRCELAISYPLEQEKLLPQQSVPVVVPLVMPIDVKVDKNLAVVQSSPRIKVTFRKGLWNESDSQGQLLSGQELRLAANTPTLKLQLGVHLAERVARSSTVVDRVWIQSWLTTDLRQDRVCYRFTSSEHLFEVTLPPGVDPTAVEVLLDGAATAPVISSDDKLAITIPSSSQRREHQLELRYHFKDRGSRFGEMDLVAPQLREGTWVRYAYWQLVLPRDEHLIVAPAGFTEEFLWSWHSFYWGRRPLWEQPYLETWAGASEATPAPSTTNRYLFSSPGMPSELKFRTASRSFLVFGASGVALALGLLLIYVPACRHAGALLILATGLLALGLVYPEPALLIGQAMTLGLVLTMLAGMLRHLLSPARFRSTVYGRPFSVSHNPLSEVGSQVPAGSSAATTIALHSELKG